MTFACAARLKRPISIWLLRWQFLVLFVVAGCGRQSGMEYVSSEQVLGLSDELQQEVRQILRERVGTAIDPVLLGDDSIESAHLLHGVAVYTRRCQPCHGATGDGNGPAAEFLYPRPRDYRRGIFKFTSTPYGSRPQRVDLIRTVRRGVVGTSMPAFPLISDADVEAVVDYVMVLSRRGELETLLVSEAENEDEIDPEIVGEFVDLIVQNWQEAQSQQIVPHSATVPFDKASVSLGRQAFLTKGCSKCHGEDGRGRTGENIGVDAWGFRTAAADLTSGMLRGGTDPMDIYRRIDGGINGTPMPSFLQALAGEPDTIWHLVNYVTHVSSGRRLGQSPLLAPILQNPASTAPPTETADAEVESP